MTITTTRRVLALDNTINSDRGPHDQLPPPVLNLIEDYARHLPNEVNFPEALSNYVQNPKHNKVAAQIAQRILPKNPNLPTIRSAGEKTKGGFVFPLQHEVLAWEMENAKDKIIVELGGASGEVSILLALAGAKLCYMNELEPSEIEGFKTLRQTLPDEIQKRLFTISGSCLDILEKQPSLKGRVDLIVCNNLIHFFNSEQQKQFFQLVKDLLKPNGRIVFTTNSIYTHAEDRQTYEAHPLTTTFERRYGLIDNVRKYPLVVGQFYIDTIPCSDEEATMDYQIERLYIADRSTNYKLKPNPGALAKIGKKREEIKKAFLEWKKDPKNAALLKSIQEGGVRYLKNSMRLYSPNTLINTMDANDLTAEETFVLGRNGHVIEGTDLFGVAQQVGIIARKPE